MSHIKWKIVACIPSRNEEWIIGEVLRACSEFCYKIIVNDDNSTDRTQEICKQFEKVELMIRPPRNPGDRQGAKQRQELLDKAYEYNPDYFLFIDADEIPSPDIIDFFNTIDETVNMWTLPWIHLWKDRNHYRIDKTRTKHGVNINWDPKKIEGRKGFIAKNVTGFRLMYDITQSRVRPSNQPINCPKPHSTTTIDKTRIIHFGKISDYYRLGQNAQDRALWDQYSKNANYNNSVRHHLLCSTEKGMILKDVPKVWHWEKYYNK